MSESLNRRQFLQQAPAAVALGAAAAEPQPASTADADPHPYAYRDDGKFPRDPLPPEKEVMYALREARAAAEESLALHGPGCDESGCEWCEYVKALAFNLDMAEACLCNYVYSFHLQDEDDDDEAEDDDA